MMKTVLSLKEASAGEEVRRAFSADMALAADDCINHLTGLTGIVFRKTYSVVKNVRPNYVEHVLFVMSDDFINAYDPIHEKYRRAVPATSEAYPPYVEHIKKYKRETFDAFVRVTDRYAATRKNHVLGKAYVAFQPQLKSYFDLAIPYLARVIEKYTIVEV